MPGGAAAGDPGVATLGEKVVIVLGQSRHQDLSSSQEGKRRARDNEDKKQEGDFQMRFKEKSPHLYSCFVLGLGPRDFQNSGGENTDQPDLMDKLSLLRADCGTRDLHWFLLTLLHSICGDCLV